MNIEKILDKNYKNYTTVNGGKCTVGQRVGYCWLDKHRGYITKQILEEHKCIEKNCSFFQKYEDAPYWKEKEKRKKLRQERKQKEKEKQNAEEKLLNLFRNKTQHIEDFAITSVVKEGNVFKVSYVSLYYVNLNYELQQIRQETKNKIFLREIKGSKSEKKIMIERVRQKKAGV